MSRFSPSVAAGPSWTQGLEQGAQNFTQGLMQQRELALQKRREAFDENQRSLTQDRENAQAGYTPAQPYGGDTPLDRVSNAGIPDAGTPASYDPTKGQAYAIWGRRGEDAITRAQVSADARRDVAQIGADGRERVTHLRFGSMDDKGNYTPGLETESQQAVQGEKLDFEQGWHDQLNSQFDRTLNYKNRALEEKRTSDGERNARPYGALSRTGGARGVSAGPTASERSAINANTARYQQPQKVPGRLNADGSSLLTRTAPGLSPREASAKAIHNVNMTRQAFGQDTLANPGSVPQTPAVDPASTGDHIERSGPAASLFVSPLTHGENQPLHPGTDKTKQELSSTGHGLPASPTDGNAPAARQPLDMRSKLMARSNAAYKASLLSRGYTEGVDF